MRLKHINLALGVRIYAALADDSRLRLLNLMLHYGSLCSADAEQVLEFTQTKTSRHFSFLKNAGLAVSRKIDRWVFWSVPDEVSDFVADLLRRLEKDPDLLADINTYKIMLSNRELAASKTDTLKWKGLNS